MTTLQERMAQVQAVGAATERRLAALLEETQRQRERLSELRGQAQLLDLMLAEERGATQAPATPPDGAVEGEPTPAEPEPASDS